MQLLDGTHTASIIRAELKSTVAQLVGNGKRAPHLVAILVGENPASQTYVSSKVKACAEVGIQSTLLHYPVTITQESLLSKLADINNDPLLDGVIVQLPLPKHISEVAVIEAILPHKDVDGFHPINLGRLAQGQPCLAPATPAGIMQLLHRSGITPWGKHCVVLGRSNIVGTPISLMLSRNNQMGNGTVTLCHTKTQDVAYYTRQADILITAAGQPQLIKADMVKAGAVVVDVGIHRVADASKKSGYRLVGDVAFDEVAPLCSYITPVPGGVGPMTIAMLLQNTVDTYQRMHTVSA